MLFTLGAFFSQQVSKSGRRLMELPGGVLGPRWFCLELVSELLGVK